MSLTLALLLANMQGTPIVLRPGAVLSKSCHVAPRVYRFSVPQGAKKAGDETIPTFTPALVIRGNGITVDFAGATLQGSPETADPDARKGLAILVEGNDVTIKNLKVRGYKVGLIARNAKRLRLLDSDFSYNWKQRLASNQEREDLSDWMSYHHNEHDEWLRYGAGVYLVGCEGFEVKGVRAQGGQCGVMLVRSNKGKVWNNDFSFLSGVGLGMYRSSDNQVMHNKIDWCVRGFSYGVYNRGQDSAGILVFEQCHRNVFAYNSVTHGGDGFFLWAGQTTMDTGKGGCNDNLLYGNDFSHAPTNGIEATFSKNTFANNKVLECWHGIWGGYSYDTKILANVFGFNAIGVAIEHGHENSFRGNVFYRDNDGVWLWKNKTQASDWGYPKYHDTDSHEYKFELNLFKDIPGTVFRFRDTHELDLDKNIFLANGRVMTLEKGGESAEKPEREGDFEMEMEANSIRAPKHEPLFDIEGVLSDVNPKYTPKPPTMQPSGKPLVGLDPNPADYVRRFSVPWTPIGSDREKRYGKVDPLWAQIGAVAQELAPKPMAGASNPFLPEGALRGQRYILVDQWGPYDFKRPILWPRQDLNPGVTGKVTRKRFEILGPKGRWRVVSTTAVSHLSASSGQVPGFVDVDLPVGHVGTTKIELEYVGGATTDYRGLVTPAGKPVRFGFSRFFAPIAWDVKFYRWKESENPADVHANPKNFSEVLKSTPLKKIKTDRLDYAGYALVRGLPNDHYATFATGKFSVPAGDYRLDLTTDDGARVWLDGKPLITNAWKYQGPTPYGADVHLSAGEHTLRVEHFQIDGYSTLKVELRPKGQ